MKRRNLLGVAATGVLGACAQALGSRPSYGIVVDYDVVPGMPSKYGVAAISETGRLLFGPGLLRERTAIGGSSGGRNSYGGALPQWVRVTWRTPDFDMDLKGGGYWRGGTVLGDYRIEIASRIPRDVLAYASAVRGRAIRLIFWLKDDGVLLAWDVQEPPGRGTWGYALHGGDFVEPKVYNGKLVEPGWYLTPDGRKVVVDR